MDQPIKLKNTRILSILTVIALACACLVGLSCFIGFFSDGHAEFYFSVFNLFSCVFSVASVVFLWLYVTKFYGKNNATLFISLGFGVFAIRFLWVFIHSIDYPVVPQIIHQFIPFLVSLLALWSLVTGRNKKIFPIIASGYYLFLELYWTYFSLISIKFFDSLPILLVLINVANVLGSALFFGAILIIVRNHELPPLIKNTPKPKPDITQMSPEQALKHLNEQLAAGLLTEEEYRQLREDIINKL